MKKIKKLMYKIYKRFLPFIINIKWEIISQKKNYTGVNTTEERERELIVSLTSFPARINTVHKTIKSLLMQSVKPDKIILWLAPEQFVDKESELPDSLLELQRYGLSIKWHKNLRSYTKLIPTLKDYPEAVVITGDDDIYYYRNWIKRLYDSYKQDPSFVYAHRITKLCLENNQFKVISGGIDCYSKPTFLHKLTGVGGVIYPAHIFYKDVLNEDVFTKTAPTNDDIWFWFMLVLNGVRTAIPAKNNPILTYVEHTQEGPCLYKENDLGEKLFWKDFYRMLEYYPQLEEILNKEDEKMKNYCRGKYNE